MEQKELGLQEMSKASKTVPDSGEMLHEGGLGLIGASVAAGLVGSGPGTGKVYLTKPGSSLPEKDHHTFCIYNVKGSNTYTNP